MEEIKKDFENEAELGKQCNHNINVKGNTLKKMNLRRMAMPNTIICYCEKCNQTFKFQKVNEKEEYVLEQ